MILEKRRPCLWKLKPRFWTYGWIRLVDLFLRPRRQCQNFLEILWFYWIHFMILKKMRFCLWKLELGLSTNGLISPLSKPLGENCPKLVFRSQTTNVKDLGSEIFFKASSMKFWIKYFFIFKFCVIFDKVMSVYSQKNAKKS